MKKRFSEGQIIGFLREAEAGMPVKELCRRHGFSEASYYLWRSKFGGMSVPDAKRLKELETENGRLKKLLAEQVLENEVINDALRKSGARTGSARAGAADGQHGVERAAVAGDRAHECQRVSLCDASGSQRGPPTTDFGLGAWERIALARQTTSSLVMMDMTAAEFEMVWRATPQFIGRWIEGYNTLIDAFRRRVRLAEVPFLALCEAILASRPDVGAALWNALRQILHSRVISGANLPELLHLVFSAPDSARWRRFANSCSA